MVFRPQLNVTFADVRVDTDWAGCLRTRKSTNGGALQLGGHTIKTWASTQAVIALSSGEAEFYGVVKGASVLLGLISLAADLGVQLKGRIHTDSTAARGTCIRRGLGKARHIHTQYLWVQERLQAGDFKLFKVPGKENPGDLMTTHLDAPTIAKWTSRLGVEFPQSTSKLHLSAQ